LKNEDVRVIWSVCVCVLAGGNFPPTFSHIENPLFIVEDTPVGWSYAKSVFIYCTMYMLHVCRRRTRPQ